MRMNKLLMFVLMAILIAAMLLPFAAAIGVSPGRTTIDFKPGAEHVLGFDIINDQNKDMKVMLEIEGDAAGTDVYLESKVIEIKASESRKHVEYKATLPDRFESPGTKELRISIIPMPEETPDRPMQITTLVGVATQLRIKVPGEGKYLGVEGFEVEEAGGTVTLFMPVSNIGTDDISSLKANITIMSPDKKVLAVVNTQEVPLEAGKKTVLKAVWSSDAQGRYFATAQVMYDGSSINLEKSFNVGKAAIEILGISAKNFQLGGIAKIELWIKSNWNEVLSVYGQMIVKKLNMDSVADIKTATSDLEPGNEARITAYWDTAGLEEGKYYLTLRINYGKDAYIEKQFETLLTLNGMTFSPIGLTGQVVAAESGNKGITVFLIVLLVIINVGTIIYYKRRKRRK